MTAAERARRYRARKRAEQPQTPKRQTLALRAKAKKRKGEPLTARETDALRDYNAAAARRARERRTRT